MKVALEPKAQPTYEYEAALPIGYGMFGAGVWSVVDSSSEESRWAFSTLWRSRNSIFFI